MIKAAPKELSGILVALITPFTSSSGDGNNQETIDAAALQAHVEYMVTSGIHGLVPGGSTGEFTTLSLAERKQLIELTVTYAAGRVPVVAGVGALHTAEVVELAAHAAQAGADAVMIVPPFYDPVNVAQLHTLFGEVSAATEGLPIMYYNIPSASGVKLTPAEIAGLAEAGVRYMKDTSGDAPALTDLLFGEEYRDKVTTFNGWDTLTFYGLAAGAKGSVWGASNFIPELSVDLWNAVAVENNLKKGREIWDKVFPICKFLEAQQYAGAVKTGVELRGGKTGGLRKPFGLLDGEAKEELKRLLERAGVKTVA